MCPHGWLSLIGSDVCFYVCKIILYPATEFHVGRTNSGATPITKGALGHVPHFRQFLGTDEPGIRVFLPKAQPVLILMDELMNFVSRSRKSGMAGQLYSFLHNLSEEARGRDNMVLAVSIPASELEMSADDQSDYERFKKLLDRVGKASYLPCFREGDNHGPFLIRFVFAMLISSAGGKLSIKRTDGLGKLYDARHAIRCILACHTISCDLRQEGNFLDSVSRERISLARVAARDSVRA